MLNLILLAFGICFGVGLLVAICRSGLAPYLLMSIGAAALIITLQLL